MQKKNSCQIDLILKAIFLQGILSVFLNCNMRLLFKCLIIMISQNISILSKSYLSFSALVGVNITLYLYVSIYRLIYYILESVQKIILDQLFYKLQKKFQSYGTQNFGY